jgi:solute carrier family 25 protein 38
MAIQALGPDPTASLPSQKPLSPKPSKSHFLSGGAGGLLSAVILQPADLLKTRLQQAPSSTSSTGTLLIAIRTITSGPAPIRSLWRGTVPSAIRTGAGSAIYFSSLHQLRGFLAAYSSHSTSIRNGNSPKTSINSSSSSLPQLSPLGNLLCGAGARAAVGYIVMPITVLKVRYESSLYTYKSLFSAVRDITRAEGLRGFFSGWGATTIRDAPYAGLYVLFYEQGKKTLSAALCDCERPMTDNVATGVNAVSGALAAAAATAVTNPFDTLKTRIQVDPLKYKNMWVAAKLVISEGGGVGRWKGRALFDGLGLRVIRKAASSALAWGLYERMVR